MRATGDLRRSFFDWWSRAYDIPVVQWAVYRPVQDAMVGELRQLSPRRILDAGCGTGILTTRMARELDHELVCGCDFSMGMLKQASHRGGATWIQGDAQAFPVRSASVDAVVSTESFHWLPDPDAALAEFARVLVPGGWLLIGGVNLRTKAASWLMSAGSRVVGEPIRWPARRDLGDRAARAGLRIVRRHRVPRVLGLALPTVVTVAVRES